MQNTARHSLNRMQQSCDSGPGECFCHNRIEKRALKHVSVWWMVGWLDGWFRLPSFQALGGSGVIADFSDLGHWWIWVLEAMVGAAAPRQCSTPIFSSHARHVTTRQRVVDLIGSKTPTMGLLGPGQAHSMEGEEPSLHVSQHIREDARFKTIVQRPGGTYCGRWVLAIPWPLRSAL